MKSLFIICIFLLATVFCNAQTKNYFHLRSGIKPNEYKANTIAFKVNPKYRSYCNVNAISEPKLNKVLQSLNIVKTSKSFPDAVSVNNERNINGQALIDLSLIYQVQYSGAVSLEKAINRIIETGVVIYAEPCYIAKPLYTPNDTGVSKQYALTKINAFQAWDISKGDTNIVIGITDTGTDPHHPDLKSNMLPGWNFQDNNNNPLDTVGSPEPGHGTLVCGTAAAVTNNITGVAGVGFKCRFMPIKMDFSNPQQSVKYAADNGCSIINCSWGQVDYSSVLEDIVNYATINKNALVVAASGNNGNFEVFYPAGFANAMGVGATDASDAKAGFSDYNYTVTAMAPGVSVYATAFGNKYGYGTGTSFASPIVAAGAALVKAQFPTYSALQLREQLRITSDIIDTIAANAPFVHKMGHGRINLYKALTISNPSVRWLNKVISDKNDNVFEVGDTIRLSGDFKNYLAAATGLTITLSCSDSNVTILNGAWTVGNLASLATANNSSSPFTLKINPGIAYDKKLSLKLTYSAAGYADEEWVELLVNPDYINLTINDIATTLTSKGRFGYNDHYVHGLGFVYKNGSQLFSEMSLLVGVPRRAVSDEMTGIYILPDEDFVRQNALRKVVPSVKSDLDLEGTFTDNLSDTNKLQILVHQKAYAWASTGDRNYYIIDYTITNKSGRIYDSLFAGIYADWTIGTGANRTDADTALKLGYTYDPNGSYTYTGVKLMTGKGFHSYGVDLILGGNGGVNFFKSGYNGYYESDKYAMISKNRYNAGFAYNNQVAQVVSSGPYHLQPNDSIHVAFIVMAADNLIQLKQTANRAVSKYNGIAEIAQQLGGITIAFPNPATSMLNISFFMKDNAAANIFIYNITGQLVKTIRTSQLQQGMQQVNFSISDIGEGLYFYQIATPTIDLKGKFVVTK